MRSAKYNPHCTIYKTSIKQPEIYISMYGFKIKFYLGLNFTEVTCSENIFILKDEYLKIWK